jgi:hypothetical protein
VARCTGGGVGVLARLTRVLDVLPLDGTIILSTYFVLYSVAREFEDDFTRDRSARIVAEHSQAHERFSINR